MKENESKKEVTDAEISVHYAVFCTFQNCDIKYLF